MIKDEFKIPIKLSLYGCNDGENIAIIGVGDVEENALTNFTSISQLREYSGIVKTLVLCNDNDILGERNEYEDWRYEDIVDEVKNAHIIFAMVDGDSPNDCEKACKLISKCKTPTTSHSFCIYSGKHDGDNIQKLKSAYNKLIYVKDKSLLCDPFQLIYLKILKPNFIGIDYADVCWVLDRLTVGYYHQFEIHSMDGVSKETISKSISEIKDKLLNELDKYNIQSKDAIAMALIEGHPFMSMEDIYYISKSFDKCVENEIIWNVNFDKKFDDKTIRVSILYGKITEAVIEKDKKETKNEKQIRRIT